MDNNGEAGSAIETSGEIVGVQQNITQSINQDEPNQAAAATPYISPLKKGEVKKKAKFKPKIVLENTPKVVKVES